MDLQVQGDAALTEEGLIKRFQLCWLLGEGVPAIPRFISTALQQ